MNVNRTINLDIVDFAGEDHKLTLSDEQAVALRDALCAIVGRPKQIRKEGAKKPGRKPQKVKEAAFEPSVDSYRGPDGVLSRDLVE
jgi:hypothetical protein